MSFLFKSKKNQATTLPTATRSIKSSDGPAAGTTSVAPSVPPSPSTAAPPSAPGSQIPTLNGHGGPRDGKTQPAPTTGSSVNALNSIAEKPPMRNTDDGAQLSPIKASNTPSPEQKIVRDRADGEPQHNRTVAPPARPQFDSSLYPWSQRSLNYTVSNNLPFPRYGAAVNSVASKDGAVYIMGGLINGSTVKGDLWIIESAPGNLTSYPVATTSEGPGPRVGHASLLVGNAFIVFGGDTKTDDTDMLDDTLYLLNTSTKQWSRAAPAGPRPPGRYGHSLNILGSKIYIFGGQVEGFFFNDIVAFDLNALQQASNRWEVLIQNTIEGGPPHGQIPPARTNHSIITWNDKLYLFGGTDGVTWFNDVWSYDPKTNSWAQLECIGYIPAAREGHAAALVGDVMYVFGGRTEEGNDLGDLAAFRISSRRWYTFQNMGPSPSPRSGHSMTAFGKHIVVVGGEPSSAPRDARELSLAYYLDTSKIRYPADSQSQTPIEQRVQGYRRPSGERGAIPYSRGLPPPDTVGPMTDGPRPVMGRESSLPPNRTVDPTTSGSRLPRAAGALSPTGPTGQPPRVSSPQSRQPTRPDRALSPSNENFASAIPMGRMRTMSPSNDDMGAPRIRNVSTSSTINNESRSMGRIGTMSPPPSNDNMGAPRDRLTPTSPTITNEPRIFESNQEVVGASRDRNVPTSPTMTNEPRFPESNQEMVLQQQNPATYQSQATTEPNNDQPSTVPFRSSSVARQSPQIVAEPFEETHRQSSQAAAETVEETPRQLSQLADEPFEETPRQSMDRKSMSVRRTESRQEPEREIPVDSGVGSSPALSQLTDHLVKELEMERSKNTWYISELALARKAGYSRSASDSPALDERSAEAFGDEDRPLVEALLKMRSELVKVQGSIDSQAKSAAARIAEVERQRDSAIGEAVFVKAKLAAHGGASPQLGSGREGTPDAERVGDMNRRLASSLAAQTELSRKVDNLIHEKDAEKQARQLAEDAADAAQKRVTELDMDRQRNASEIESLRGELHEVQKAARETAANHSEIQSTHKLLTLDHTELSGKFDKVVSDNQAHALAIPALREALGASTDKTTLLEQKLEQERRGRDELEEKLTQLKSQHEDKARELETASRRLQDAEELAEKHAAEARTHRQAVLDGLDKFATRDMGESAATDERVTILQQHVEGANAMVRQNQAAADLASEKLRRAEERIAGLEAYQEQSSREGLTMRKQLQVALRDAKGLNEERNELQQLLQSQQLETNAITVQHGALKNILSERGINQSEARRSRTFDSPSSQIRYGTPDLQRVKELEMQLEASLKSHDDMKSHIEEMQDREGMTRKEYEEKLTTLDHDHQAAVRYLRGTEKMLSKMKSELQRVKNQAADYSKELDTLRAKDSNQNMERSASWEQEKESLRRDLETMRADLESKVADLRNELSTRESDLEAVRESHKSTQSDFANLRSTHDASRADLERLHQENTVLEERARDAENKVQLLLDQVESSVDNYRRQSLVPHAATNGSGHHRGLSDVSVSTMTRVPTHSRGPSAGDSVYSQSIMSSEVSGGGELEGPDGRNSLALDSLASELDALRSHWETTKNYRQSDRFDYEKTPTSGTAPGGFPSLVNWRRGLDVGDEDDGSERPSTAGSAISKPGSRENRVVSPVSHRE